MSELNAEEVSVKKKPLWKRKVTWVVAILVVLFLAYKLGSSPNVPEGIGENYYSNALWAYHEINVALKKGELPSDEVLDSIGDNAEEVKSNPTKYTEKERYISEEFGILYIGLLLIVSEEVADTTQTKNRIYEALSNLANVLEVDEEY